MHLKNDIEVIELWINLFSQAKESCTCEEGHIDNSEDYIKEDARNIDFELKQCLILDMLDHVLLYFCSAHLSDILSKYMDTVLHEEKSVSLQHKLISGFKKVILKNLKSSTHVVHMVGNVLRLTV